MKAIERLYEYLESKDIKPGTFEKQIQLSQGYLGKMYKRKADMGEGIILQIIENCPEINLLWLMTGKGEMTREPLPENCSLDVCSPDTEFYKALSEERKEEIKDKEREIARLNILVGRYEERLTNFQSGNDLVTPHGVSVSFDRPRDNPGGSTMQELPISSQGTGDPLSPHSANPDE